MVNVCVIIPFYNAGSYLQEAVESVIVQDYAFTDIHLLLIDDGSNSNDEGTITAKFYANRYPNNIEYIRIPSNKGVSVARNIGIERSLEIMCRFIFFLDSDDKYRKSHIKTCIRDLKKFQEAVCVVGTIEFFEAKRSLDPRFNLGRYKKTILINASQDNYENNKFDWGKFALYVGNLGQCGWKTEALLDVRFNESLTIFEDVDFICRTISTKPFIFSKDVKHMYFKRALTNSLFDSNVGGEKWYAQITGVYLPLYEYFITNFGSVPLFVQQTVLENIYALFDDKSSDAFENYDYSVLDSALRFIIKNTDDVVLNCKLFNYWNKMYLLVFKYGSPNVTRWAPLPTFVLNETGDTDSGERYAYLGSDSLTVHIINEKQNILTIRASMRCLTYKHFDLIVDSDYENDICEVSAPFQRDKVYFYGREVFPSKYYEIKINLNRPKKRQTDIGIRYIRFYLQTDYGIMVSMNLDFLPHSGLGYNMPFTLGDSYIFKRTGQKNVISVSTFDETELLSICSEIKPYSGIGTPNTNSVKKFEALKSSILNNFRAFSSRRIWVFMDRGYEVGNNAEALFRYCAQKDDGILKYYIIPDESYIERFEGLPYMVIGTLEYKLLCCFAEKFISSYLFGGGLTYSFGVDKAQKELWEDTQNFKKLTRAFFRGDIIHVQHGVIMQDVSYYLNKFDENFRMLPSVSKKEYEYIKSDLGNAIDADTLRLTGLPRLDELEKVKNNPKSQKIVIFAPSFDWKYFIENKYIPEYKFSEHFRYLNSIINSPQFLDMLEDCGYKLYFKPHYLIIPQLRDFEIDSRVTVVTNEIDRYELYAMCDLMISDFSGIAFDFAYLKKPVVYAHFIEAKYNEVYFSYEHDGFGEICNDLETLVETISLYVGVECKMSAFYQKRVDSFYSIQDDQNCERIYQEMLELPDTRKNIFESGA